jgi:hypothetical protein
MKEKAVQSHPDHHAIDDWFLYGPKSKEIESLVRELTIGRGLRLAQVENDMIAALKDRLRLLEG